MPQPQYPYYPTPPAGGSVPQPQYPGSSQQQQQPFGQNTQSYAPGNQQGHPAQTPQHGQSLLGQQHGQQPQAPQYGQSSPGQHPGHQPQAPQYGQSAAGPRYGQPAQAPQYGQPSQYGQSSQPPQYGASPQAPQYGQHSGQQPPPSSRPQAPSFMDHVNSAVSSSKPLLRDLTTRLNKKLDGTSKPPYQPPYPPSSSSGPMYGLHAQSSPAQPAYGMPPASTPAPSGPMYGANSQSLAAKPAYGLSSASTPAMSGPLYGANSQGSPAQPMYGMPSNSNPPTSGPQPYGPNSHGSPAQSAHSIPSASSPAPSAISTPATPHLGHQAPSPSGPHYGASTPSSLAQPTYEMPAAATHAPAESATSAMATPQTGKKWYFVDQATEQPTPEFIVLAGLIFESMHRSYPPRSYFVTARQILEGWKADGSEPRVTELFEYDSYKAFSRLWSLQGIPHVLVPTEPTLIPTLGSFAIPEPQPLGGRVLSPAQVPPIATAHSQFPTYMPALSFESYVKSIFFDNFEGPENFPKVITSRCGDLYKPGQHPDMSLYDPTCPPGLQAKVKTSLQAAVERVLIEIAQERAAREAPPAPTVAARPLAQPTSEDMTALEAQLKMQHLQTMSSTNDVLNQTMAHGGQSFNASASNGVWVQKY